MLKAMRLRSSNSSLIHRSAQNLVWSTQRSRLVVRVDERYLEREHWGSQNAWHGGPPEMTS